MKKPKAPRLVTVAITTTITIIFWIFFTLYQVLTTKPSPSVSPELLEPISPVLDTDKLDKLNKRTFFEEGTFTPPAIQPPSNNIRQEESIQPPSSGSGERNI